MDCFKRIKADCPEKVCKFEFLADFYPVWTFMSPISKIHTPSYSYTSYRHRQTRVEVDDAAIIIQLLCKLYYILDHCGLILYSKVIYLVIFLPIKMVQTICVCGLVFKVGWIALFLIRMKFLNGMMWRPWIPIVFLFPYPKEIEKENFL